MAKRWKYDSGSRTYKHYCYLCLEYKSQTEFSSAGNAFCLECNKKRNKLQRGNHKTTKEEVTRGKENKRIKETISKLKESNIDVSK